MEVSGSKGATCKSMELGTAPATYEHFCSPCSADGHNQDAFGYCSDCREHLCQECCKMHGKGTLTKHRVLPYKADIAQGRSPQTTAADGREDELTDPCPIHADKVTEYHCKGHNQTACTACVMEGHRSCAEVKYIRSIAKGIADSQECRDIEKSLNELTDKLYSIELQTSQTLADITKASTDYIHAVRSYRDELVAIIDKLVTEAEVKMQAYVDSVTCQLINARKVNQTYLDMIGSAQTDISNKIQSVCEKSLFVKLKHAETLITECKESISTIEKDIHVNTCKFKKKRMLFNQLSSCESIGELVTEAYPYLCDEINVKAPTDTGTCYIIGMVILGDGMLVLIDFNNKSVKLFDRNHVLTSRVPLQSRPWDIAEVSSGEVAVCMGDNSTIQFMSVTDTLTTGRVIETAVPCVSVAPCGDRLALCILHQSREVVMLDMSARKVNTVWTCPCEYLRYVRLHPDNNDMYVSHVDGVTRVTLAGKVVGEYRDPDLVWSKGLTVHPDGSVYVCGNESHNIHHMTADCTKKEVLCKGQVVKPRYICYNHRNNTLYVSESGKDTVKVFKLHD